eukprot:snap_masked-scaffold_12-processed-gene-10.48-mRNA-1 protein AED:1.00 eAED:1.00 QI:0/-1/0/0/-1/1/1/0/284
MCILFLYIPNQDEENLSKVKFILASNRDEFYNRETTKFHLWENGKTFAGQDMKQKGTWLGFNVNEEFKFGVLTNLRPPLEELEAVMAGNGEEAAPQKPSRGCLIIDYLQGEDTLDKYVEQIENKKNEFAGFNVILADKKGFRYVTNHKDYVNDHKGEYLKGGTYGLSNSWLNDESEEWKKVQVGKQMFKTIVEGFLHRESNDEALNKMLEDLTFLMSNNTKFTEQDNLSGIFVDPNKRVQDFVYGTRSQFALIALETGLVVCQERTLNTNNRKWDTKFHTFTIE